MSFTPQQPMSRREARELESRRPVSRRTVVVRRKPEKPTRKSAGSSLLSFAAMVFAAALLVGASVPANAFMTDANQLGNVSSLSSVAGQTVAVSEDATVSAADRADFTVTSYAELLRARYGNRSYSYTVGRGAVQWPFPYPVPISDGFGERPPPCRGCSSFHRGTDFTPGAGTAIYAIASGTVIYTEVSDRGMGNNVIIAHTINGQSVQSLYAHMEMNSSPLNVGDVVNVGDFVGLVGHTGTAIGAHLHLEIHIKGQQVDPYAWLKANAAG